MLCTNAYVPDQDTHQYKSSVTNEVVGTGYTAGGLTLTSTAFIHTVGTNTIIFHADDVLWTGLTITARYAVIYDATPASDATRPLICYIDFGADVTSSGGNFPISWDPVLGIFYVVAYPGMGLLLPADSLYPSDTVYPNR